MASMTFQINDASTSAGVPAVWVTITENSDGTLTFSVTQEGGIIGDLRGLFFDLNDESLIGTLTTNAVTSDFRQGDDSIKDLGDGANMNGLLGSDKGYDAGIEIGTAGIGKDDIRSYSFTLDSSARDLTLADFSGVDFGVRLTSVGIIGGARTDSSKIMENTFTVMNAQADAATTNEDATAATTGNVLSNDDANDTASGSLSVTGWSGGNLGEAVTLENTEGATLQLNADGSYVLDASASQALSAGETIEFTFTYNSLQQVDGDSATDQATFTVSVEGRNDGPVAGDDSAGSINEDGAIVNADVTGNDTDIDRLDTHTWALVADSFDGEGTLTFNDDGTWSYNAGGAYDYLNNGDFVDLSFQYAMNDNHGGSDTALVSFRINGVSDVIDLPPPQDDPALDFLFNHGGKNDDHGFFPQSGHDNTAEGFTDNDTLKLAGYGDILSITIDEGNFNLGDSNVYDTQFVVVMDGNPQSTRTTDTGYLVDYTGLEANQIDVTSAGNSTDAYALFYV